MFNRFSGRKICRYLLLFATLRLLLLPPPSSLLPPPPAVIIKVNERSVHDFISYTRYEKKLFDYRARFILLVKMKLCIHTNSHLNRQWMSEWVQSVVYLWYVFDHFGSFFLQVNAIIINFIVCIILGARSPPLYFLFLSLYASMRRNYLVHTFHTSLLVLCTWLRSGRAHTSYVLKNLRKSSHSQ